MDKLKARVIPPEKAMQLFRLGERIRQHSSNNRTADEEATRYFSGVDGRNRPFWMILFLFMSILGSAQTTVSLYSERYRIEIPDSTILVGDHTTVNVYSDTMVVIYDDLRGMLEFHRPSVTMHGNSTATGNQYTGLVFGDYGETQCILEYYYNPRTKLWGFCIQFEGSTIREGMPVKAPPFTPIPFPKEDRRRGSTLKS